jgi:predicted transposase YdaD
VSTIKEAYEMQTIPLREVSQQIKRVLDREEGRAEGKAEKAFEVARSMLADGFPSEAVRKYTGLDEKEMRAVLN